MENTQVQFNTSASLQTFNNPAFGNIRISETTDGEGQNITTKTTKITGKGQIYFINKFLNNEETENENN